MKTARFTPARLVGLLLLCLLVPAFGFDKASCGIFCTLPSDDGKIYTVQLRVPKDSSGPCILGLVGPSVISGPLSTGPPYSSNFHNLETSVQTYTTNFTPGSPPLSANNEPLSHDTIRLLKMKMKDLEPLTLINGNILRDCRLLTFQSDGVIVVRPQGVYKILFSDLDAPSRQQIDALK